MKTCTKCNIKKILINFIKEYNTITIASKELKIDNSTIVKCAKNKRKTAGGFKWKYKESNNA